jgi:hypothetical protein
VNLLYTGQNRISRILKAILKANDENTKRNDLVLFRVAVQFIAAIGNSSYRKFIAFIYYKTGGNG